MKVRLVVMVPEIVDTDYNGDPKDMTDWAHTYVKNHFHLAVPTGAHASGRGPTGGTYVAKLMECTEVEDILDELVAPTAA